MAWQPGESGNPAGGSTRPKIWRDAINRAIKRREESDPLAMEKLADRLIRQVEAGDVSAIKEFGDRVDGKVAQPMAGADGTSPMTIALEVSWTSNDGESS
jgi:hypothetical protein